MPDKVEKAKVELQKFGLVMTIPLAIIGGVLLWRGKPTAPYFLVAASLFLISGLFFPNFLKPIERIWMRFAEFMSAIMTRIILTLTFYLIITPFGLVLKIVGKDILKKNIDKSSPSYWVPVEKDGPCTRPEKPY